jgi:hypothetical protein
MRRATSRLSLKVSENGRYFVDGQGKPFLYHADTGWQLFTRLTPEEALKYLATRKQQGFTAIQVMFSMNPDSATRRRRERIPGNDHGQAAHLPK